MVDMEEGATVSLLSNPAEENHWNFPADGINAEERLLIQNILSSCLEKNSFQIFPRTVEKHLTENHGDIVARLRDLPGRTTSVVIAFRSLLSVMRGRHMKKPTPHTLLCDVCVFSTTESVLVLTITSAEEETEELKDYVSVMTTHIAQSVRNKTKDLFTILHGVLEEKLCQSCDDFSEKISQIQRDAQKKYLPPTLVMTQNKCLEIIDAFLYLLPVDILCIQSTAMPDKEKDEQLVISRKHFTDMTKEIEQLKQTEADLKREKEKFHEETEKLKQELLTDTRLSLLMRTSLPSVNGSTSGYGSTDQASHKQEAVFWEHSEAQDKDPYTTHPELATEAIHTGDIDLVQYNRDQYLHQACKEGQLNVIKYILSERISDIDCRGQGGKTPVMTAAVNGQVTVFDFLISQGCDLTPVADNKNDELHLACIDGNIGIVRTLVANKKYDVESKGYMDMTPVLVAALNGNKEVFDFLVSRGSDLSVVDDQKDTILHLACFGSNIDIVKYILSYNIVDIESRGHAGRTAVMAAVSSGKQQVFEYFVSHGGDLTVIDDQKNTILHLACYGGNVDIVRYIVSHSIVDIESRGFVGRTPVTTAVSWGKIGIFEFLVSCGCDVTVLDDNTDNILHLACCTGNLDIVTYIVSHNIVDIESRGFLGRTPVMFATETVRTEIVVLLVRNGCKLTTLDDQNNTILHVACVYGHTEMVKYLLTFPIVQGMRKIQNKYNETPVQVAEKKGHAAVASNFKAITFDVFHQ